MVGDVEAGMVRSGGGLLVVELMVAEASALEDALVGRNQSIRLELGFCQGCVDTRRHVLAPPRVFPSQGSRMSRFNLYLCLRQHHLGLKIHLNFVLITSSIINLYRHRANSDFN